MSGAWNAPRSSKWTCRRARRVFVIPFSTLRLSHTQSEQINPSGEIAIVQQHVFIEGPELHIRAADVDFQYPEQRRWYKVQRVHGPVIDRCMREVRNAVARKIEIQLPTHFLSLCR